MAPSRAQVETNRLSDHAERRQAPRISRSDLAALQAWLASGPEVQLVDLSLTGARFLAPRPMPPGVPVALRVVTSEAACAVAGHVTRSQPAAGPGEPGGGHEVAVAFDEPLATVPGLSLRTEAPLVPGDLGGATDRPPADTASVPVAARPARGSVPAPAARASRARVTVTSR